MSLTRSKILAVIQVSSGSCLEAFDLIVFGTFANVIGQQFFPKKDEQLSLIFALATFASAYVMRFVGAVLLGPYFDRVGRRRALLTSFMLMAVGTALIALAPNYESIGVWGALVLIAGRLIQGISVGAETGSVNAYLVEIASKSRGALYVSWNSTSFHVAVLLGIAMGWALNKYCSLADLAAWGWRVPYLLGCSLIPLIFVMRRALPESEAFLEAEQHRTSRDILMDVCRNWRIALLGMLVIVLGSCIFYFMFTFMPLFVSERLGLSAEDGLRATVIGVIYSIVMGPTFAIVSDKVGRLPMLVAGALGVAISAYPALFYLAHRPSYGALVLLQLWFATLYSAYSSSSFVGLSELIPARIRATGYGVSTTLGLALFGGGTPLISAWLVRAAGNNVAPSFWLIFVALASLAASILLFSGKVSLRR